MIGQIDLYSAVDQFAIEYEPAEGSYPSATKLPSKAIIGTLYCFYSVRVTNNLSNSGYLRSYIVTCRQRLVINNPTTPSVNLPASLQSGGPGMIPDPRRHYFYASMSGVSKTDQKTTTGYYCYPVWAMSSVSLAAAPGADIGNAWLLDYQPRTLNSMVNLSSSSGVAASGGSSEGQSNMVQKTTGASNTTTQSYDVSLSLSQFGGLTGSASTGTSHSTDHSLARSSGADRSSQLGHSLQSTSNASMAIKDWGLYSSLNVSSASPTIPSCTWFLSQEYPYSFLATNAASNRHGKTHAFPYDLNLSSMEVANVFPCDYSEETLAYSISPPTELAILGGDFTLTSSWQIDTDPQNSAPIITPSHVVDTIFASHFTASVATPGTVCVVGQVNPGQTKIHTGPDLDLSVLALDPITHNSGANGAIVGFLPSGFLAPITSGAFSRSVSADNNLMVLTEGFTAPAARSPANNAVLSASLVDHSFSAQINVCFKLAPFDGDLNLYLKHWVGAAGQACELSMWFNPSGVSPSTAGKPSTSPDLVFTVNTTEGSGGDNNLLVVNLRNLYYDSVSYHDYLVPGLNVIVIGLQATKKTSTCDYLCRTVAIGD
ncbi:hypothetical protein [Nisaea sp.]|uniref:hypothetical protein n=1 Tax=Nisaea sp. TaxID=2024842 RepID=UPI00326799BA